ncbi:MAG: hypothetical protein K9N06_11780 [Candidatus Cloacimonetes bacterium]|nr:hypothetical protein [Candidatus Cloacimonadota bacterium]
MKYRIPLLITFITGLIILVSEFIPAQPFSRISTSLETWVMIISGFAMLLGLLSLFKVSILKIKFKATNWQYYIITLVSCLIMIIFGFLWGTDQQSGIFGHGQSIQNVLGVKPFDYLFNYIYQHLSSTMFALLAFFIASAAYRAFIGRTTESRLLLIAAIIVMLGRTSLGSWLTGFLPDQSILHLPNLAEFIMKFPNTAGQRAIMIGSGLGVIGSSLRILLGIERMWLGGE